jgi:hypothetical protein
MRLAVLAIAAVMAALAASARGLPVRVAAVHRVAPPRRYQPVLRGRDRFGGKVPG